LWKRGPLSINAVLRLFLSVQRLFLCLILRGPLRDAQGNVLAIYNKQHNFTTHNETGLYSQQLYGFNQKEQHLYGSSRLGIVQLDRPMTAMSFNVSDLVSQSQGVRNYELTNHLGNVLSTITDKGVITSTQDYYRSRRVLTARSFGMCGSRAFSMRCVLSFGVSDARELLYKFSRVPSYSKVL
jgi:hypothetical protein